MRIRLRQVNTALLVAIIAVNGYIIVSPFVPKISYWWQRNHTQTYQKLQAKVQATPKQTPATSSPQPQPNELIAPDMLLDTPVYEGSIRDTYKTLNQGIWRWPLGSTPDRGGNTVLIGHRFTYTNPRGIFYNMDKVKIGDEVAIRWAAIMYRYKVTSVNEVSPSDTAILDQTTDNQLTMYTCTPTWNPIRRLVVVAKLEGAL